MDSNPTEGQTAWHAGRAARIVILFVLIAFAMPVLIDAINPPALVRPLGIHHFSWMTTYIVLGLALLFAALALMRRRPLLQELGLAPFAPRPVLAGAAAIAAMAGVLAAFSQPFKPGDPWEILIFCLIAPVFEELVFRGLGFRQLRRWAGLPFWPAALVSSVLFGAVHWSQGSNLTESAMASGVTFLGGLLFCWTVERWQSLWLAILLHAGMNTVWSLFAVADNAVGGLAGNVARLAAVAVALGATFAMTARRPA